MENNLRQKAEEVLIAWERSDSYKRKQLLEFLGIPAIISDINGVVLDYNTQAYLILRLSHDQLYKQNLNLLLKDSLVLDNSSDNFDKVYKFIDSADKSQLFFINSYENQKHIIHFLVRADGYRKPEDALLITEQKYRNLVENAVEGIFVIGLNGFYLVNESFCKIFGYNMEEILDVDPYNLVPIEERDNIKRYLTRKLEARILMNKKVEQVLIHKQGHEVVCEMSFFSTIYNGEYAIQGHVRDISQIKRVEKELKESAEIYRLVMENAYDNVCIFNASGIVYANKKLCETIGYDNDEILGKNDFKWVAPEYQRRFLRMIENTSPHKPSAYFHADLVTKQGIRKAFVFTVSTILFKNRYAYLAIGKDISLKKQQEKEKRIEKRKDTIVNRILRIVAESKGSETAFLEVVKLLGAEFPKRGLELCIFENDNVLKVYSFIDNKPRVIFVLKDENENYFKPLENQRSEFRIICQVSDDTKDDRFCACGFKYMMQLTLTGLNKPFGFFRCAWKEGDAPYDNRLLTEIILDIAIALESSLYREKIARITREAAQNEKNKLLSKLSLIGEMSTTIAHEVRNPMTTVRGLAQLLKEENPAQDAYFQLMIDEIDKANTTITEFLNLAQNRLTRKEAHTINPLINVVLDLMQAEAVARGINLISEVNIQEVILYIDSEQIKQALMNILQNALEASQMGDKIIVKVSQEQAMLVIEFQDEGIGVEDKHLANIMEPFFTTKDNNAGLGLSVSFKIIRDHGGDMVISSVINKGTTVKVSLPINSQKTKIAN